jgi:hypothetical protein
VCAKNTRGRKWSTELDSVAKALLAMLLVRLRTEAIAGGQTFDLVAARRLLELKLDNPIVASGARRDFSDWLHKLCQTDLPEQLLWFVENLCDVDGDFAWVQREIERISSDVTTEICGCIGIVCAGRPESAGWIVDETWYGHPNEVRPANAAVSIGNYVEEALAQATKSAVNHARVLIAKRDASHQRLEPILLAPPKSCIQELMSKHPG